MFIPLNYAFAYVFLWSFIVLYVHNVRHESLFDDLPTLYHHNVSILVFSRQDSSALRQAARDTWAQQVDNHHFFVGRQTCPGANDAPVAKYVKLCEEIPNHVRDEQVRHGDVVILPMIDSYANLPLKMRLIYRWAIAHTTSMWLLKIDDDTMVFVRNLNYMLLYHAPVATVIGCIRENANVERSGKWMEEQYRYAKYPKFPLGSCGYVMSRDVAEFFSLRKDWHLYQGEDVSVGIWLNESGFATSWIQSHDMTNDFQAFKCSYGHVFAPTLLGKVTLGHGINPQNMRNCHRAYLQRDKDGAVFKQSFTEYSHKEKKHDQISHAALAGLEG
jgi:hypothetical protein